MNILITGCSSGIGFETVLELMQTPGTNILGLARNSEKLKDLQKKCESIAGSTFYPLEFDLEHGKIETLLSKLESIGFKSVDTLINNAGTLINKPFENLSAEDWKKIFDVNLFGIVRFIQATLPHLKKSKQAHIVNIGSFGGFQGSSKFPGLSAYSSSKAALANLSECLAEEFKPHNIHVNCLALGAVQTEMFTLAFPTFTAPTTAAQMGKFVAWFAIFGRAQFNGKVLPVTLSTT